MFSWWCDWTQGQLYIFYLLSADRSSYVNKIFSGNQPCQLVIGRNRRFENHLRPHHQGSDVQGIQSHQNPDDGDEYIQEKFEASSHIRTLMMGTEMVPETSVSSYNQLMQLIAREDFIEFSRCKNFKSYRSSYVFVTLIALTVALILKHHTVKTCTWHCGKAPCILSLDTRWSGVVVRFMLLTLLLPNLILQAVQELPCCFLKLE
jgi:hypothetical protein